MQIGILILQTAKQNKNGKEILNYNIVAILRSQINSLGLGMRSDSRTFNEASKLATNKTGCLLSLSLKLNQIQDFDTFGIRNSHMCLTCDVSVICIVYICMCLYISTHTHKQADRKDVTEQLSSQSERMASRPGLLTDWPWTPLGSSKVLLASQRLCICRVGHEIHVA